MPDYIVNKQPQSNGVHEVHETSCGHLPDRQNQQPLGYHSSCESAVRAAKRYYPTADGCYYCSEPCHSS